MTEQQRRAAEAAALQRYCPVHRVGPGHLCILLETGGAAIVTTGICATRMATTLEGPR